MSRVYLVRHGQAGTRQAYDSLSDLGRRQARLLGEYFISEGMQFAAAFSGTLTRQEQTAAEVKAAYQDAGAAFPEIVPDCGWNEFDLTDVYRALAPQMCAEDAEFRREYEEMARHARAAAERPDAEVNRRWMPCDTKIVEAWVEGRYPYHGESWQGFLERVAGCRARLGHGDRNENIVVFTSATPIGVWTALALEICDKRVLRLAGVLHNTSCTVIRLHHDHLRLDSFNSVPHLGKPEMRTHR
ncbi:MAG TPA: histidine phosphatase family protein [Bryobacteraceae bacterium]|nr:histidine phosphatase family protein [Bryobacteraceae bacterium]